MIPAHAVAHVVRLQGVGGVERHCQEFLAATSSPAGAGPLVVTVGRSIEPGIRTALASSVPGLRLAREKHVGGLKIPGWPPSLRASHVARLLRSAGARALVVWNRPHVHGILGEVRERAPGVRIVHWEHGRAWFPMRRSVARGFCRDVDAVIVNSHAARRVLELAWSVTAPIAVCPNGLRPSLVPGGPTLREPGSRPLVLGAAGRLSPVKGICLALHALAILRARGTDARLRIAGDGALRESLEALARRLRVADSVELLGSIDDMAAFYAGIDVFVHPALREPFGLVCLEAMAHGRPVVGTSVDGIPEVVGSTGVLVPPSEDLAFYERMGGSAEKMPSFVYDPASDRLAEPRVVPPEALADAVQGLAEDPDELARAGRRARERALGEFDFRRHVEQVGAWVAGAPRGGRRAPVGA